MSILNWVVWTVAAVSQVSAHFTIWHPSMYGFNMDSQNPIGPGIMNQNDWWFRGPATVQGDPPAPGQVMNIIAGSILHVEVNCNKEFTSYGSTPKACPYPGPYHGSSSGEFPINPLMTGGCALAIADVDDINKVNWNNLVVFSVQRFCVLNGRSVDFAVPSLMPKCTGSKCICAWLWQPQYGEGNFYMTGFDCSVTQIIPGKRYYSLPQTPAQCDLITGKGCVFGAKSPVYIYNNPENIDWQPANNRPGYRPEWSFMDGAQNDIFTPFLKGSTQDPSAQSRNVQIPYGGAAPAPDGSNDGSNFSKRSVRKFMNITASSDSM